MTCMHAHCHLSLGAVLMNESDVAACLPPHSEAQPLKRTYNFKRSHP